MLCLPSFEDMQRLMPVPSIQQNHRCSFIESARSSCLSSFLSSQQLAAAVVLTKSTPLAWYNPYTQKGCTGEKRGPTYIAECSLVFHDLAETEKHIFVAIMVGMEFCPPHRYAWNLRGTFTGYYSHRRSLLFETGRREQFLGVRGDDTLRNDRLGVPRVSSRRPQVAKC